MNDSTLLEHPMGRRADGPLDPANAQEVIELWLESAQRHGDGIPESDPVCERMIAHGDEHLIDANTGLIGRSPKEETHDS